MQKELDLLIPTTAFDYSALNPIMYEYFNQRFNHRTVLLNAEIDEGVIETVILPLKEFESDTSDEPVTLILNTVGGSVVDGLPICSLVDTYAKPLNIIVPAYACSMGTVILCSGNKNPNVTKTCYPFSFALFHSGEEYLGGEAHSVRDRQRFNEELDARIRQYVISNTTISPELFDSHRRDQWYLNANEMLQYGLVNKIIGGDV